MPKEEWGVKRVCPTTGKRFYDLNRNPIVSPYTSEVVELDTSKTRMIAADAEDMSSKANKTADLESEDVVLDAKIQRAGHKLFIDPSNVMPHRRRRPFPTRRRR